MLVTWVSPGPPGFSTALKSGQNSPLFLPCRFTLKSGGMWGMIGGGGVCVSVWSGAVLLEESMLNTFLVFNQFRTKQVFLEPSVEAGSRLTAGQNPSLLPTFYPPDI